MAVDLEQRAAASLTRLQVWSDEIAAGLTTARADRDRRHPAPDTVDPADWAQQLGATQHVATARTALATLRAELDRVRARLAGVTSPADTTTFKDQLRAGLIRDAALRVALRRGQERLADAEERIARFTDLTAAVQADRAAGEAALKTAATWQGDVAALLAALGRAPLDTVVADAAAVRTALAAPAHTRLATLLPDPLLARALTRATEAASYDADVSAHAAAGALRADRAAAKSGPLDSAVEAAQRTFVAALTALRGYVATAPVQLAVARATLLAVAALPDVSAAQREALDPATHKDAVTAATNEGALATAVAALAQAERGVDDARLDAMLAHPDLDPAQDTAVKAAVAKRDDDAVQKPLTKARADYDTAVRAALDAWEVEAPDALWQGAADLATAATTLDRLADQAARDALLTGITSARDSLGAALDNRDEATRATLAVAVALTGRAGKAAAASATAADRAAQYLRGDGPGGRTPAQL